MKLYKLDAVVLKARDMREADKMITLYSIQRGKQRAVAHGAAKPNSRKRGAVQPFCYSTFMMHQGRELDSVSQAELREAFPELRSDLDRLTAAAYVSELTDGFTGEGEPNQGIFALLLSALHLIAAGETELALRAFEARLIGLAGFKPELNVCSGCGEPLRETKIHFSSHLGSLLCRACASSESKITVFSRGTLEVLKTLYRWELTKLHQLKVPEALKKELSALLRAYIEYNLEKRLKTTDFLDRLYKSSPCRGTNI
ncbi:DNA repair protein RecO [Desulforamulus putei]|uniref:DNA repair protein RecO n=1 Tax=Desulforamulus putei DSM 12395 TaxID=1121429 RepID=A0A1M5AU45_9FIRM|nr:DNA repair protein RecO [Desulforamulus putei]SHF33753.1 DNA replication and repair protein RecO [Desulforamulus putei DSM 12395]